MAAKRLFDVSGITCIRGGRLLFQNLSFGMQAGDVVHLCGPNGAGKTSLLRILCGALAPSAGQVTWQGEDFLKKGLEEHTKRYSFLPADDRSLKGAETARENLSFWAEIWGVAQLRIDAALAQMDIASLAERPVKYFSAGQKRRLSLARALMKEAPLWLLDEPLNGLDIHSYDLFMTALQAHAANGGMAAVASHYAIEPPRSGQLQRVDVGVK